MAAYTKGSIDEINKIVSHELEAKHWGTIAPGNSPSGAKRFYVFDYRGLGLVTGIYRYKLKDKPVALFYRGQVKDYPVSASLFRKAKNKNERAAAIAWEKEILSELKPLFDPKGTDDEREALAQHYGLHTRFIDVADNIQTAIWFAYDWQMKSECKYDDDVGYISILGIPTDDGGTIMDLRRKPSQWLRPHVQQAFVYRAIEPEKEGGCINRFHIATLIIPRSLMRAWSNYDCLGHDTFYPPESHDAGLRFWLEAKNTLESKGYDLHKY